MINNNSPNRNNRKEDRKFITEKKSNYLYRIQNNMNNNDDHPMSPSLKTVYAIQNSNLYFNNIFPNISIGQNDQQNINQNNNQIIEEINTDININNQNAPINNNPPPSLFDRLKSRVNQQNLNRNLLSNSIFNNRNNNNNNNNNIIFDNRNNQRNDMHITKAEKDDNTNNKKNKRRNNRNNSLFDSNNFNIPKNQFLNSSNNERNNRSNNRNNRQMSNNQRINQFNNQSNNRLINLNDIYENMNNNKRIGRHNNFYDLMDIDEDSNRNIDEQVNINMDKSLSIGSNSVMDIDQYNNMENMNNPQINSPNIDAKQSLTQVEQCINRYKIFPKNKKHAPGYTYKMAQVFITYIGDFNNNQKHDILYNYFKQIPGYGFTYCVKDRIARRDNKCKYHYYTEFKEGVEIKLSELGEVQIDELNLSGKIIKKYMIENGELVYEDGAPFERGVLSINKIKDLEPGQRDKLSVYYYAAVEKLNRLDYNLYNNCLPYKNVDVFYIYVKDFDENNETTDLIFNYLQNSKVDYDVIYYKNNYWFGISREDTPVAVYRNFSDYEVPYKEFIRFISKFKDEMEIKGGVKKNLYSKIIIISYQKIDELYVNTSKKENLHSLLNIYTFDQLNEERDLNTIFRLNVRIR